ncbi:hypothetical protein [uncultured Tateyamaria sp.]|uniref:hypothetical protein n=1 Tax=uncultured Tateyamaria sp. TaxID=455651 RepID=UPI002616720F|nr:hypothetical protein [uncultured Tateyamaria sp.]
MCAIVPDTITCQTLKYDRPGDYPFTDASDIDGFMIWLKNSLLEDTELLSNAVGFWVHGALAANAWDTNTFKIPGVNTGFPKDVSEYPKK